MADTDLDRLALLRTRFGRPAKQTTAAVRSTGARFKTGSRGLAAASGDARRGRTLEAADGSSLRESFAGVLKRSSRS
jgi:hypothetical protein